jgi:hypothetical protein
MSQLAPRRNSATLTRPGAFEDRPHDRGELGMNPFASRNQGWLHDTGDRATDLSADAYAMGLR